MVTLSIQFVTVVSNGKEVLVGVALVALILASKKFRVIGVESQTTAVDDFISIFDSLLQTSVVLRKFRIGLRRGDSCYLFSCQWVVTPYKVGTCQ